MTVALTGASGQLGRLTADRLPERVDPADVVLITRNPDALAEYAGRGVTVRAADFDRPETLPAAFAGVEQLLLISGDQVGSRLDGHRNAIAAAVDAGVRHLLYTSISEPVEANPAAVVPDHAATEQALRDSGVHAWTSLRNNLYTEMQVPTVEQAAQSGQLVTNYGDGAAAFVTREDCAAVAAAVLAAEVPSAGEHVVDVTGPEAVSADDLAALASTLRGEPVEVVRLDDESYVQGLVGAGLPEEVARLLASFGSSTRLGYLAAVSPAVEQLTGRPATRLADLLPQR
ncbi:NAD(P)H dehydrogenase (quinone) [Friedmanniella endophytica]|uniref:NAD(P)H dehydrogenase (Quinone) n=1 Tax=Microlunatus kandeliicorticis TaxID=1759536 RepID=A0A7W3IV41_9ACTN|nr:NAD(P)H-binding protein [Microlunatus kandeliicorticis]MBA8795831.1 NAD(P)H dehydrogenase (quinone) [Microlunatus kandeliicorticis]